MASICSPTITAKRKLRMKINKMIALCGMISALSLSAGTLSAQDNSDTNGGGGRRGGGQGGRGNFDPAQFQQRMMDTVKERLGFTNETEWSAVQPLVQKVMDARRDMGGFGGGFRRGGGGGGGNQDNGGNRRNIFNGETSPEAEALQKAIDANAPTAQIKSALEKYRSSQKDREAKLEQAQANLRKVLTSKQEAQAVLLSLLK
jgi:hypothetical protein